MPKSTKDLEKKLINSEIKEKKSTSKKTAKSKKADTSKKITKSEAKTTKKNGRTTKSSLEKTTTNKKGATKKNTTVTKKIASKKTETEKEFALVQTEYYDLPYRYDQTIVKVLAQTPTSLFIYWDISDTDKDNFKKQYGDNFFETTKPVLVVHNDTIGYSFEVEINDFANSWYLQVHDSKCNYKIELGRRPFSHNGKIEEDFVYITSSNTIQAPNDKILLNKDQKMVYFRNAKTNQTYAKEVSTLSFIRNMGKVYNIYDVYKTLYKEEAKNIYKLNNPSS